MLFRSSNSSNRGGIIDFVISLIVTPPNEEVLLNLLDMWEYIPAIREICIPYLLYFNPEDKFLLLEILEEELMSIIDEIKQILAD